MVPALKNVSLTIDRGSFICLKGPSGSGKTTLLNILGLIEPIQKGDVLLNGQSFANLTESEKNGIRRERIGFIFQSFHLFPVLSARENVEYFLIKQGIQTGERKRRVEAALRDVGLLDHGKKRPLEMSGGQRQRVAIARAIAKQPEVILADEPTASLDQNTGRDIMEIFLKLNQERGTTIIVSSHDPMVQSFTPKHISLRDGEA